MIKQYLYKLPDEKTKNGFDISLEVQHIHIHFLLDTTITYIGKWNVKLKNPQQ